MDSETASGARARRALLLAVAFLALAAGVMQQTQRQLGMRAGADLAADYASAQELLDGRDPYAPSLPEAVRRHI
ncbi:MAG: hypothetical protein ACREV8_11875, partial [Gammaproteobacteria bacterium]